MENKSGRADRKTRTSSRKAQGQTSHPYQKYVPTKLWKVLDRAVDDLVKNRDIVETTNRVYIVGYLCKAVASRSGGRVGNP